VSTVSSAPAYSSLYAHWLLPSSDLVAVAALALSAGVPIPVASLLLQRGVADATDAARFLHPALDHLLDP
jgi:single-stranded-DNA-specific exonuclease